jgi:HK97 family phage prohead protease
VRVIASHEGALSNGERVLVRGVDLSEFKETRGVVLNHKIAELVGWCRHIAVDGQCLIATVQMPPAGVSRRADRALAAVRSGELAAASISFSVGQSRTGADGVREITRSVLREISLCREGGNPLARVLSTGLGALWDNKYAPRRPTAWEAGSGAVEYARALERFRALESAAPWRN